MKEFIAERKWDGLILTAAPTEVLNPGLFDDLKAAVSIPFTTALNACVARAASLLRAQGSFAYAVRRALERFDRRASRQSRCDRAVAQFLRRARGAEADDAGRSFRPDEKEFGSRRQGRR